MYIVSLFWCFKGGSGGKAPGSSESSFEVKTGQIWNGCIFGTVGFWFWCWWYNFYLKAPDVYFHLNLIAGPPDPYTLTNPVACSCGKQIRTPLSIFVSGAGWSHHYLFLLWFEWKIPKGDTWQKIIRGRGGMKVFLSLPYPFRCKSHYQLQGEIYILVYSYRQKNAHYKKYIALLIVWSKRNQTSWMNN